jgi:crotonobetaine/carnitine-CoA ligase
MISLEASQRTLPELLERAANAYGDAPCLSVGGVHLSYLEIRATAAEYAAVLATAGVGRGDRVAAMTENRWELLALWLGCAWRGSVLVPINTASRGPQLEHVISNAAPRVMMVEPSLASRLAELDACPPELELIWSTEPAELDSALGVSVVPLPAPTEPIEATSVSPGDTAAILYTSGTTGPAKGVMCPHAQFTWWGQNVGEWLSLSPTDTAYTCLPLFHTNALNGFVQALMHGSHYVVGRRFSASRFWESLIEAEATVTYVLGAMVSILLAREPSPRDRTHSVRIALAPGCSPETWEAFESRFGVKIVEGHGMTETNAVIGMVDGEQRPGLMGRVRPGFQAKVVDANDIEVPSGTPGELVMRADEPFAFAAGYWRAPEATAASTRNLWFHSGDRVVRDADGYFQFLDRIKDAIRRRGENISAWEIEQVLVEHPAVSASAAIPVPSELGEDDVMACVVLNSAQRLDPVELVRFCEPKLAYFAIPRYIEFFDELPLTENGKVRKYELRERGLSDKTWDREAAGIEITR